MTTKSLDVSFLLTEGIWHKRLINALWHISIAHIHIPIQQIIPNFEIPQDLLSISGRILKRTFSAGNRVWSDN